jgi:hypothetical protein
MNVISTVVEFPTSVLHHNLQSVHQLVAVELISSLPTTLPLAFDLALPVLNLLQTSMSTPASTTITNMSVVSHHQNHGGGLLVDVAMIATPLLSQIGWKTSIMT